MSSEYKNEFLDWEAMQDHEELFKSFLKEKGIEQQEWNEFLMKEYEESKR